jgi:hypothetical protein
MIDETTLRSIRILALNSVENPGWEDFYRKICRWYSREFSTPLKEVEKMSEFDVLLTYFEDKYEEMATSPVEEVKKNLEYIKEVLIFGEKILEEKESEDDKWAAEMAEQLKHEQQKDKQKQSDIQNEPNLLNIEDRFDLITDDQY